MLHRVAEEDVLESPSPHISATDGGQPRPDREEGWDARLLIRRRSFAVLAPLVCLLLLWIYLFTAEGAFSRGPNGKTFGADFAMFLGAAKVLQAGGDPYNPRILYRTESQWMAAQHLSMLQTRSVVRVGNPPILFWALRPWTGTPFQLASYVWTSLLVVLSAIGFLALLASFGWRTKIVPTVVFLLMPQTVLGPFYGNITTLVFVSICFALAACRRWPAAAGILLSVVWLKPQIGLPVALLIIVLHTARRTRCAAAFGCASTAFFALNLLTAGPHMLVLWLAGLAGYSRSVGASPAIVSFTGLYARALSHDAQLIVETLSIAGALVCTALVYWQCRNNARGIVDIRCAWLWPLWLLVTPYAHFFDEVLLAIPLVALLGKDGCNLRFREPAVALYLAFASLLVISAAPHHVQLLWLPLTAITVATYRAATKWTIVPLVNPSARLRP